MSTEMAALNNLYPAPLESLAIEGRNDVALRLMRLDDYQEFYSILKPGGANLDRFQYWEKGFTPEGIKEEFENSTGEINAGKMLRYEIIDKIDNAEPIIGEVCLFKYDEAASTAELGYLITPNYEGRGIVLAASKQLLNYGMERWQLKRILLSIEVGNERSEHLAIALGAQLAGTSKQVVTEEITRIQRQWEILNPERGISDE